MVLLHYFFKTGINDKSLKLIYDSGQSLIKLYVYIYSESNTTDFTENLS